MTMALPSDAASGSQTLTTERVVVDRLPGIAVAGIASLGAGAIHAGAIGLHAEHTTLARLFVVVALFQLGWGLIALWRPSRAIALVGALGNAAAVAGWVVTRIADISWIGGLEQREAPQFTDTAAAALALVATGGALAAVLVGRRSLPSLRLAMPALAVAALTVPAMWVGSSHVHAEGEHGHGGDTAAGAPHDDSDGHHDDAVTAAATGAAVTHRRPCTHRRPGPLRRPRPHRRRHDGGGGHGRGAGLAPPVRPDRTDRPLRCPGVTPEQEARATALLASTQDVLPKFADTATATALGFRSIGDAGTGWEHYINYGYIGDEHFLNPEYPESLVYQVDGEERTLVSAMFIARQMPVDSPEIVDYGGPLMQWHIHDNLCWGLSPEGEPR